MRNLGWMLPSTLLVGGSLAAGTALLVRSPLGVPAPAATAAVQAPRVVAVSAQPARPVLLDTVTVSALLDNDGQQGGPYRATLELLPVGGGPARTLSQSGFVLRHNQQLALYWEWRAGASLPVGAYTVRVTLRTPGGHAAVAAGLAPGQLRILPR